MTNTTTRFPSQFIKAYEVRRGRGWSINKKSKLDGQGFAPTIGYVRKMANQLLAVHGGGQVGEKWATNLIRRKPVQRSSGYQPLV